VLNAAKIVLNVTITPQHVRCVKKVTFYYKIFVNHVNKIVKYAKVYQNAHNVNMDILFKKMEFVNNV